MFDELNKEIAGIMESLRKRNKIQVRFEATSTSLEEEKEREIELKRILEKEKGDVKKLESLSLSALMSTWLGNKDEKLSKERQEYLEAKLKYEECFNHIQYLEGEIESYKDELKKYTSLDDEYKNVIKKKEELILNSNNDNAKKLLAFIEQGSESKSNIKEIEEAIQAGVAVEFQLNKTLKALKNAQDWGAMDLLGGGMVSSMIKHSSIDDAQKYASEAHAKLNKFKRELKDINIESDIVISIDSFDRFIDCFWDNFFMDWSVQEKINKTKVNVEKAVQNVSRVLDKLYKTKEEEEEKLSLNETNMKKFIESAGIS